MTGINYDKNWLVEMEELEKETKEFHPELDYEDMWYALKQWGVEQQERIQKRLDAREELHSCGWPNGPCTICSKRQEK